MGEKNELSRRKFMQSAIFGMGGIIGVAVGVPAIVYVVGPSLKSQGTQSWIRLGSTSKVELSSPTLFTFKFKAQTGWIVNEEEKSAYVLTTDGRTYIAMSNICTHLGCRVRWIEEKKQFFSPCHNGVFDMFGNVVSGPPPRPLDRYEIKVEADQLYVLVGA
jgi:Rieske Fe-S protein